MPFFVKLFILLQNVFSFIGLLTNWICKPLIYRKVVSPGTKKESTTLHILLQQRARVFVVGLLVLVMVVGSVSAVTKSEIKLPTISSVQANNCSGEIILTGTSAVNLPLQASIAPVSSCTAPESIETAPVSSRIAPILVETAPVSSRIAPKSTEIAPVSPCTASESTESAPVSSRIALESVEIAPASACAAPVLVETAPIFVRVAPVLYGIAHRRTRIVHYQKCLAPVSTCLAPVLPKTVFILTETDTFRSQISQMPTRASPNSQTDKILFSVKG